MHSWPPDHAFYDERSLSLHRLIATRLQQQPELLSVGRETLKRWAAQSPDRPADLEWSRLLDRGVDSVIAVIVSGDEEGRRLRQSSPLLGILSQDERTAHHDAFRAAVENA